MASTSDVDRACTLVREYRLDEAESQFQALANDLSLSREDRADCYQMLGVIVEIDPSRGRGDDVGLFYYRKALELVPDHLWASYAIATTYGSSGARHEDFSIFQTAMKNLERRKAELDAKSLRFVVEKARETNQPFSME